MLMGNQSKKCYNVDCQRGPVVPIYFRDGNTRGFRVAFYICKNCNECTDFWHDEEFRMPFLYKISKGYLILRLIKEKNSEMYVNSNRKKILEIKKSKESCIKCGKKEYERIFVRDRPTFQFVGYVCKSCRVIYMINYRNFRLNKREPVYYKEFCKPTNPEIPVEDYLGRIDVHMHKRLKEEMEDVSMTIRVKDIPKLRKLLEEHNIRISSSSNDLTPLPRSRS